MAIETFYISERFFTKTELEKFEELFKYKVSEIKYSSTGGEIDFSDEKEKTFLLEKGFPMILARFFT
ncbi:hypothetical protein [Epilithonimonas vandammei]|uniref:hypothetical protein n=1 Tax=Epilithonimonas vandammei TaxID=2487072 RepID=UPI0028B2407C|nr:hypothetical protein [Epilithonimonas vandammei]